MKKIIVILLLFSIIVPSTNKVFAISEIGSKIDDSLVKDINTIKEKDLDHNIGEVGKDDEVGKENGVLKSEEKQRILKSTENIVASISSHYNIILPNLEKIPNEYTNNIAESINSYISFLTDFSQIVNQENDISLFNKALDGYRVWTKTLRFYSNINSFAINAEQLYTLNNTSQKYSKVNALKDSNKDSKNIVDGASFNSNKEELDILVQNADNLIKQVSLLAKNATPVSYASAADSLNNYKSEYELLKSNYSTLVDKIVGEVENSTMRVNSAKK